MGRIHRLRELISHRDFAKLVAAQCLGQAGDGVAQGALAVILVLDPLGARTPGRIFGLFALTLLPYSLISPFMGVVIDRYSRRNLLVWTSALRALVVIALLLLREAIPGSADLYVSFLILLGLSRLFLTTKGATLPTVLGEHNLLSGNALSSGAGMIAALFGGILGVGISGASSVVAFVGAALLYASTALVSRRIAIPTEERGSHETFGKAAIRVATELVTGAGEIIRRKSASVPLIAIFLLRTIGMIVAIAAILVIKSEFPHATDSGGRLTASALALGVIGAGAFLGTIAAPAIGRRVMRGGLIATGFVVSGIAIVAVGGIDNIAALLTLTFAGGFGGILAKVAVDASVQDALPRDLRGRAFALYDILYNCASVVAGAIMVATASLGLRPTLVASGVLALTLIVPLVPAMRSAGLFDQDGAQHPHSERLGQPYVR